MRKYLALCFNALFLLAVISCNPNRILDKNEKIPDGVWDRAKKLSFTVNIPDTSAAYDIYINVRNAGVYQFSNLFLFINTTLPDGRIARDTAECTLSDAKGEWLGDGLGDIWDNSILFKKNMHFPLKGNYTFELEQAMRTPLLPGIMDAGIRIEKISADGEKR